MTNGIVFMLVGIALISMMDATAKYLVMQSVHTVELLALRGLLIVPAMLAFYKWRGRLNELTTKRPWAHTARGVIGIAAPLTFFMALQHLPLSSAVVVFFSSMFMTTVLSVFILGERVGRHRWLAVIVGYAGVVIAMSPGFGDTDSDQMLGYVLVLISSLSYALLFVTGRLLSRTESVSSLVLSYNGWVGLVCLLALPWFWQTPSVTQWSLILLFAALALLGHFCITHAFAKSEASVIAPLEYTGVIWAVLLDLIIFRQLAGATTWIGAVVIISCGLYVVHRERLSNQA